MERSLPPYDQLVEDDYIDMDINSATFLRYTVSSPQHSREFEFQMSANPPARQPITSPADELFYKGKLLPLHLPPRLQMVQNLLESSYATSHEQSLDTFDDSFTTANTSGHTAATTPFESCNISPTASCYLSAELHPEDYFHECSARLVQSNPKKSWSKKLKLIKPSSLGLKLKASRAYLKTLFTKSGCSDESCEVSKASECSDRYSKAGKKNPFDRHNSATGLMKRFDREKVVEEECAHRRSFSGAIKRHSMNKSSSSASSSCSSSNSSSFSSASSYGQPTLKRSSSVNSEVESSIQGAIAYCKKSQQLACARKSVSEFAPLPASKIAAVSDAKEKSTKSRKHQKDAISL